MVIGKEDVVSVNPEDLGGYDEILWHWGFVVEEKSGIENKR